MILTPTEVKYISVQMSPSIYYLDLEVPLIYFFKLLPTMVRKFVRIILVG